jgi:hypothetical protein
MEARTSYPARLDFDGPQEVQNWRPLVNWLLAIPQLLIGGALQSLGRVLLLISLFTVLFTKAIPRSLFDVIVMTYRYRWRVGSYALWMRNSYPPFDFTMSADDPGSDPAKVSIDYPEQLIRWGPLYKWFLAIPHFVVLIFLFLGAIFVGIAAFFAVLFTGKYPAGMRDYLVGVSRWKLRVAAYAGFLRDEYPPFSLS